MKLLLIIKGSVSDASKAIDAHLSRNGFVATDWRDSEREAIITGILADNTNLESLSIHLARWLCEDALMPKGGYPVGTLLFYNFIPEETVA